MRELSLYSGQAASIPTTTCSSASYYVHILSAPLPSPPLGITPGSTGSGEKWCCPLTGAEKDPKFDRRQDPPATDRTKLRNGLYPNYRYRAGLAPTFFAHIWGCMTEPHRKKKHVAVQQPTPDRAKRGGFPFRNSKTDYSWKWPVARLENYSAHAMVHSGRHEVALSPANPWPVEVIHDTG